MSYNNLNKTIFEGINSLPEADENGVINITDVTNNRVVIILEEGDRLKSKINAPDGTNIMFFSNENKTEANIEFTKDSKINSRTYGMENSKIINGYNSHNKNISFSSINYNTQNNGINSNVGGFGFNLNTLGNAKNINVDGNAKNVDTKGNSTNKLIGKGAFNHFTDGHSINFAVDGNAVNFSIKGDAINEFVIGNAENNTVFGSSVSNFVSGNVINKSISEDIIIDGKNSKGLLGILPKKLRPNKEY